MRIWQTRFGGMVPWFAAHLLPDNASQEARNVDLSSGAIVPRKQPSTVNTPTKVGTKVSIYRFGKDLDSDSQYWLHWLNDTDVTRGPIPDDVSEETYYTERGQPPRYTDSALVLSGGGTNYPNAFYLLGLPQPTDVPTLAISGTGLPGSTASASLVVTYTFVNDKGREGPPAVAASNAANWVPGQVLTIGNLGVAPVGNYNVVSKRIYVQATDSTGASNFKLWITVPVGQTSSVSALDSLADLGDDLEQPFLLPPRADLFGVMAHPGAFLVGFSGKRICRSEVERPHGWPQEYEDPVSTDILGGAIVRNTTIVYAKGSTVRFAASDPVDWQPDEVIVEPTVSKRSIAVGGGAAFSAAQDGVVMIGETGEGQLVTARMKLISRADWATYKPETMLGFYWDNRYIVFYDNGVTQGGLLFDFEAPSLTKLDLFATAGYVDPRRNELYLQIGANIVKFQGGVSALTGFWRSKEFRTYDCSMVAGRVDADSYPVTFRLYGDGALRHTQTVTSRDPFMMPVEPFARRWYWETEGTNRVTGAGIAEDTDDLSDEAVAQSG